MKHASGDAYTQQSINPELWRAELAQQTFNKCADLLGDQKEAYFNMGLNRTLVIRVGRCDASKINTVELHHLYTDHGNFLCEILSAYIDEESALPIFCHEELNMFDDTYIEEPALAHFNHIKYFHEMIHNGIRPIN